MSIRDQENTIGLLTWHQITTVVILKQNMRQQSQSIDDAAFRKSLENMRYAACTTEDLKFLDSRTVGPGDMKPKLNDTKFRDVSIITAWNAQKDLINELGCKRFADDTGQELTDFYSIDLQTGYDEIGQPTKKLRKGAKEKKSNHLESGRNVEC